MVETAQQEGPNVRLLFRGVDLRLATGRRDRRRLSSFRRSPSLRARTYLLVSTNFAELMTGSKSRQSAQKRKSLLQQGISLMAKGAKEVKKALSTGRPNSLPRPAVSAPLGRSGQSGYSLSEPSSASTQPSCFLNSAQPVARTSLTQSLAPSKAQQTKSLYAVGLQSWSNRNFLA